MNNSYLVWIVVAIIIVGGGYWYWSSTQMMTTVPDSTALGQTPPVGTLTPPNPTTPGSPTSQTTTTTTTTGTPPLPGMILGTNATATLGTFLVASNGMTLYTFTKDSVGTSTCYGGCATAWPPYTVPTASSNINVPGSIKGAVSTITRADGTLQVTYKGMPIYFYQKDTKPGDTTGQNVGGVWFVAKS